MFRVLSVVALLLFALPASADDPNDASLPDDAPTSPAPAPPPGVPAAPTAAPGTGPTSALPGGPEIGSDTRYAVGARDVLNIEVYGEKDISGSFTIGDDGTIDFPLLGHVSVLGLTPPEIDDALTAALAKNYLINPQVTVRIEGYSSQPVQVLGSVGKPGTVYLFGPTRLLDILTLAGGIKDEGAVEVRVQHKAHPQQPDLVNIDQLVTYGTDNVAIQPGDVVYVPPGPLIFVSGQVQKPGTVAFRDGLTVVQAINKAGGATAQANLRRVFLLRGGVRTRVNARKVLDGKMTDVGLQPDDHIIVNQAIF